MTNTCMSEHAVEMRMEGIPITAQPRDQIQRQIRLRILRCWQKLSATFWPDIDFNIQSDIGRIYLESILATAVKF